MYGVELDSISGRIAKQLYPHADIQNVGYEKSELPDNFFDVVIGNIPFGSYKVSDKRYNNLNYNIHDYFIAKSLDKVRAGGVIAVVTSSGTMDKQNPSVRRYIAQRAELLGAIRLPNNAFKENANTEVTADILFLQKRDRMIEIEPEWIFTGTNEDGFTLNQYFIDNPNMVLGTITEGNKLYGRGITCAPIEGANLSEQLAEALKNIGGSISEITLDDISDGTSEQTTIPADPTVKNYSYTVVNDDVYYRVNSIMEKMELPKATSERIKGMIEIRECVRTLMDLQLDENTDEEIQHQQLELNKMYDTICESTDIIGVDSDKSGRQIRRYIRLTELIIPLLDKVDLKIIPVVAGAEVSFLNVKLQVTLNEQMDFMECKLNTRQAKKLKQFYLDSNLDEDKIEEVLLNQEKCKMLRINYYKLKKYFPQSYTAKPCEKALWEILDEWYNQHCA